MRLFSGNTDILKSQKPNATTQFFKHGCLDNLKIDHWDELKSVEPSQVQVKPAGSAIDYQALVFLKSCIKPMCFLHIYMTMWKWMHVSIRLKAKML